MERILQQIARIRERVALLRSLQEGCRQRFIADPMYRGALLHYLYLVADGCIVLAEQVIKLRSLRFPQSYAESFDILGAADILRPDFAYHFAAIAGFRNFLAHDYEVVDPDFLCGPILGKLDEVEDFLRQIEAHLGSPADTSTNQGEK
jgi:uncharacterized protein YutE (UPF0331/DUF86 family)